MPNAARPRHAAFTLLELLVVVGIIALLVAILIPALGGARRAARRAVTESQCRDVVNASASFLVDTRRAPGVFAENAMGDMANEDRGFTAFENALLDLAGGVVQPDDSGNVPVPGSQPNLIEVGPYGDSDGRNRIVDTLSIGSSEGPGYLQIDGELLVAVAGQVTTVGGGDQGPDDPSPMPDYVDAWGMPLLFFRKAPGASFQPDDEAGDQDLYYFSARNTTTPPADTRPGFYWASNAGYLNAGGPTDGLGEERVNVHDRSYIGGEVASGDESDLQRSLAALLGSPAFPIERSANDEEWRPAEPRGDVIVVSGGPDRNYLAPEELSAGAAVTDSDPTRLQYVPSGGGLVQVESGGGSGEAYSAPTIDDFDDIIQGGAG